MDQVEDILFGLLLLGLEELESSLEVLLVGHVDLLEEVSLLGELVGENGAVVALGVELMVGGEESGVGVEVGAGAGLSHHN